jgi:hypothetical protein
MGGHDVSTPTGRWVGKAFVEFTPDEVAAVDAEWAAERERQAAEAADRDVEALIASEMRAAAIARVLARDDVPADVRARLIEKQGR